MLTPEVRREKALRHFVETFGEERGVPMWEDYCRKSGLLAKDSDQEVEATARSGRSDD